MELSIEAMVYGGVRYPISHDTAEFIIDKIESIETALGSDFIQFATTDGRQVLLHISHSLAIAFESAQNAE